MFFSEKVLVIRTGRFKEYDLWVRFLTPSRGVLTGFAFGGCRSRKRFSGCLDVLNLVLLKVSAGKNHRYLVLEEGSLVNGYPEIKKDPGKLGMAVNSLRFVQKICPEGDDSSGIYSLFLDYLGTLESNPEIPPFFPLLFRARATFSHGFEPSLDLCCRCSRDLREMVRPGFLYAQGRIICEGCRNGDQPVLQISKDSLAFLNRLKAADPGFWLDWHPAPAVLQDCLQVVESFVRYHLDDGALDY